MKKSFKIGIICGWGSFAVLYSTPFGRGHYRECPQGV